jgi:DNA-binding NarL/FixJ family response regulator
MSGRRRTSLLVASSDRLFADAVATSLSQQRRVDVIGWVSDGMQALAMIAREEPECVLVLGRLTRLDADDLARQARHRAPGTRVVSVADAPGEEGFTLPFDVSAGQVLEAVTSARASGVHAEQSHRAEEMARLGTLTRRERQILQLAASGRSGKEIAGSIDVSANTVRTHLQNVYAKLDVHSRLDLVSFAARHGLMSAAEDRSGQQR